MGTIGARIIVMRERVNMTQVTLSQKIGVTKATMSKYENNKVVPNAEIIGKIADALNTTTDYLIGRTRDYSPLERGVEWVQLSEYERNFPVGYRLLSDANKIRIAERMETLLEEQRKKPNGSFGGAIRKNKQAKST